MTLPSWNFYNLPNFNSSKNFSRKLLQLSFFKLLYFALYILFSKYSIEFNIINSWSSCAVKIKHFILLLFHSSKLDKRCIALNVHWKYIKLVLSIIEFIRLNQNVRWYCIPFHVNYWFAIRKRSGIKRFFDYTPCTIKFR